MPYLARIGLAAIISAVALTCAATTGRAAEVTFFCASALKSSMEELLPRFESTSGHHVKAEYGNVGSINERVRKGDAADLVILSPKQFEGLQADGKVRADGAHPIARVGIGLSILKGRTRPDIGSVETFKAALHGARSIAVGDPMLGSPAGIYTVALLDRLGIGEDIRPKLTFIPPGSGNIIANAVVAGADLGIDQISLIVAAPTVELVGPLPSELQNYTSFVAAVPVAAKDMAAALDLVHFLSSPEAAAILRARGLEPG